MADSLIDFNQMAQTMIGMGHLAQQQRRNQLYEQNVAVQQQQNALESQRLRQQSAFKAFDEIQKLKDHPAMAQNRPAQIDFLQTQGKLLEQGLGVRVPLPSSDELAGGYDAVDRFVKTLKDGTPQEKMAASLDAMASNPTWGRQMLDDAKKAGDVSMQLQEMDTKLQLNQAKLTALNLQNAKANLQQNFFSEHVAGLGRVTGIPTDPRFQEHFQKVINFEKPEARATYLALHPDFKQSFDNALLNEKLPLSMMGLQLQDEVDSRLASVRSQQAKTGEVPAELQEELSGYEAVRRARKIEADWLDDPFNKQKWKALKKSEQDIRILNGAAGKKLSDIADQRTAIMQAKFDQKTQSGLAESALQDEYLKGLNAGQDDNQALGSAIQSVKQQFPGVPFDATKVINPSKKGRLEIGLTQPTKTELEKDLLNQNLTQQTIDDIREIVEKNPQAVGAAGNVSRFLGGIGQQALDVSRSAFAQDRNIEKGARNRLDELLSTKPADELQALTIGLTYRVARQLSGTGTLSDKDIAQADKLVAGLRSASGSQQFLNHLGIIEREARRRARQARTALDTKTVPGMQDTGVSDMPATAEDYLKSLGVEIP